MKKATKSSLAKRGKDGTKRLSAYYSFLDALNGSIDLKTRKKTHFAEHVDDIYLKD
ncbi:MAG: hypothetical protein HY429_01850 [Candidatus Levybacteria bacterium]|nr:hypothetical protein [Candidatus Levybacteria bacterium]